MVIHKCPKCTKEFSHKCDFTRHINKKNSCIPIHTEPYQNVPKNTEIQTNVKIKVSTQKDKNIKCNYCDKLFSQVSSLNRHLKDRCKIKKLWRRRPL